MSKLTKFLKNPKIFFKDSMYFGLTEVEYKQVENLFVITTFAQLKNIENLIKLEGLENNYLVILFTSANLKMPNLVFKKVNFELFKSVSKFLIPTKPSILSFFKVKYFLKSYWKLIQETQPKSIYIFSFQGHYTILNNIAKSKNIKTVLVEEGTASYKDIVQQQASIHIFKKIELIIIKKIPYCKDVSNYISDVDVIYSAFPKLMLGQFKSQENFTFLHPVFNAFSVDSMNIIKKYKMTRNDVIYVNQKYAIDVQDHVSSIINILGKISKEYSCKVFVKMHPNDTDKLKEIFKSEIGKQNNIIYIDEESFLVESIIAQLKPKMLLGLTSTALVYCSLISSKTQSISIANEFVREVGVNKSNSKGCSVISDHFNILRKFDNIYEYSFGEIIKLSNHTYESNLFEDFIFYEIINKVDCFFESNLENLSLIEINKSFGGDEVFEILKSKFNLNDVLFELSFYEINECNYIDLNFKDDSSLLRKYVFYKKNLHRNKFKSFYYIFLIKSQIGFVPKKMVNDYIGLMCETKLHVRNLDEVLKLSVNNFFKLKDSDEMDLLTQVFYNNDIKNKYILEYMECFQESKLNYTYKLFYYLCCGESISLSNHIDDVYSNNSLKGYVDLSLLLLSGIFYNIKSLQISCLRLKSKNKKEEFVIKSLFLIYSGRGYLIDSDELEDFYLNNNSDLFLILLKILYLFENNIGELKGFLINHERLGFKNYLFQLLVLKFHMLSEKKKIYCIKFEALVKSGIRFNVRNWLYYLENVDDKADIYLCLSFDFTVLDSFDLYVEFVRKFTKIFILNSDVYSFDKFIKLQKVKYNLAIIDSNIFADDEDVLRVFKLKFNCSSYKIKVV